MLFGRKKDGPPDAVRMEALPSLLNGLFDSSMRDLKGRSDRALSKLEADWKRFSDACDSFEKEKAEPDLEDLHHVTRGNIEDLKENYTRALNEALASRAESKSDTVYEECKSRFDENDYRIKNVLQINHRFRPVIIAYSSNLDRFKSSFSEIERHLAELKLEIERNSKGFESYNAVKGKIERLFSLSEAAAGMEEALAEPQKPAAREEGVKTAELEAVLEQDRKRIAQSDESIAALRNRIFRLINPLDRAAKKFDHVKQQKEKLHDYITDAKRIETSYSHFIAIIGSLEAAVNDLSIDLKNRQEVLDNINEIKGSRIDIMLSQLGGLEDERRSLRAIEEIHQRNLNEALGKINAMGERERRRRELEQRLQESKSEIDALERELEAVFLSRYSKRIKIEG